MTDIITQVEQVIIDHTSDDVSAGELAQALADAGLLADPARTVPTRRQIAASVAEQFVKGTAMHQMIDAIHALMDGQPTAAEVKAEALEEAAELLEQPRALWFEFGIGVTVQDDTNRDVELTTWLRERAQQHRDGE